MRAAEMSAVPHTSSAGSRELPELQGCSAEDPFLIFGREEGDVLADQLQFLAVRDAADALAVDEAGAPKQALRAEGIIDAAHGGEDIGVGVLLRLRMVVKLGDLDVDIGEAGEAQEVGGVAGDIR